MSGSEILQTVGHFLVFFVRGIGRGPRIVLSRSDKACS